MLSVDEVTPESFRRDFLVPRRPVVLVDPRRGAATGHANLTPDKLRDAFGDAVVPLDVTTAASARRFGWAMPRRRPGEGRGERGGSERDAPSSSSSSTKAAVVEGDDERIDGVKNHRRFEVRLGCPRRRCAQVPANLQLRDWFPASRLRSYRSSSRLATERTRRPPVPGRVARLARALRVAPGVPRVPVFAQRRVPRPRRRHASMRRETMASVPPETAPFPTRPGPPRRARASTRVSRNVIRARDTARDVAGVPSVNARQDTHCVRRRAARDDRRSRGLVARGARGGGAAARRGARRTAPRASRWRRVSWTPPRSTRSTTRTASSRRPRRCSRWVREGYSEYVARVFSKVVNAHSRDRDRDLDRDLDRHGERPRPPGASPSPPVFSLSFSEIPPRAARRRRRWRRRRRGAAASPSPPGGGGGRGFLEHRQPGWRRSRREPLRGGTDRCSFRRPRELNLDRAVADLHAPQSQRLGRRCWSRTSTKRNAPAPGDRARPAPLAHRERRAGARPRRPRPGS